MKTKSAFFTPSRFLLCSSLVALMLCSRFDAWAVPAAQTVHTLQQPDGTAFKARLHGDEFFHYYTTEDGHPLTCDPDSKWFTFAAMAEEGVGPSTGLKAGLDRAPTGAWKPRTPTSELEARKKRKFNASVPSVRRSSARDGEPSPVTANVAMFLTTFSDRVATADPARPIHQAPAFETLFFDTSDANALTAANLYKQMSYGLHTVTSGPSGIQTWATAPKKHEYYGAGVSGSPNNVAENGARVQELVKWRVQNADATFDFGPYDTDNNGVVDLACIVYQGTDQANSGLVNDIWPIRWTLDANTGPGSTGTGPGSYQTADRNAAGNLVRVNDFIVISELFPGPTSPMATIGVFAHEYGHGIGWPDFYDTDYSTAGLGDWCLMATGCYNRKTTNGAKGDCPSWANAWCRIKSGWLAPQNPTYNILGYRIPEAKRENFVLKLSLNGAGGLEYFLVENRQRTGWDQGLPGGPTGPASGLMIWHVDDALESNSAEWWSTGSAGFTTGGHRLVAMEQADRIFQLDRRPPTTAAPSNVGNSGDGGDLFTAGSSFTDSTVPSSRTYAGTATNVAVRNISAASAADASITADIFMQADQGFPEILTMNPSDGLNYYIIPSLVGTARDNTALNTVRVALQRHSPSGDEWYGWTASAWQGSTYEETSATLTGAGTTRDFFLNITAGHLTPGSYSYFAKAIDTSGAGSAWRESRFTVLEDPNGPDVTISEPSNWENYPAGVVPNFAGTAVNTTGTNSVQIAMKMESGPAAGRFYNWTNNTWSAAGQYGAPNVYLDSGANWVVNMAPRPLGEGNYTLFVRVTSGDTRISPWRAVAFRVGRPFGVTISSPRHQSAMQRLVELSGTVDDPSGTGLQGGAVTLTLTDPAGRYWNGSAWSNGAATFSAPAGSGSWVFTSLPPEADLPAGSYALTASATTNGGESSVVTAGVNAVNFHVDRTPPTGQVTSPVQNAVITTPSLPPFRMTAFDTNGIAWVNCFIRRNADQAFWNGSGWTEDVTGAPDGDLIEHAPPVAFLSAGYNAGLGEWECTSPLPSPASNMRSGSYSFIAIPGDAAGNYFQTESTITVDYHPVYTWTGLTLRDGITGNDSTYWGTPANWSPYGVPGEGDIAVIANGDTVNSTVSRTLYGLRLGAGHLNFTNGPGENGTLTTTNASNWTGGAFSGQWDNVQGAVLTVSGSGAYKDLGVAGAAGLLNNAGTLRWAGGSWELRGYGGSGPATINNETTGVFDIAGNGTPLYHQNSTNLVFNNHGRIVKSAGTGGTYLDVNHLWTFNLESGSILENAVADPAALLYRSGGGAVTNVKAGAIFRGPGRIHFAGGTPLNAEAGAWTIDNAATLELAGMVLACPQTGSLTLEPSTDAALRWTAGTIHGNLVIPADATLTVTGLGAYKDLGAAGLPGTIHNSGILTWTGESTAWELRGYGGSGPATINNLATGVFDIAGNGEPLYHINATNLIFNNDGRIIKSAGTGTTGFDDGNLWVLNNSTGAFIENAVAGSVLQRNGANAITNIADGPNFSGPGTIRFGGGTPLNAVAGTWNVSGGAMLHLDGMVLRCPQTGSLTLQPSVNSTLRWTSGTIHGNLVIPAAATLEVTASGAYKDLGAADLPATLTNRGTIRWTQGSWQLRGFGGTGAVTINNETSGVFDIAGNGTPLYHQNSTNLVFNNRGRIVKSLGDGGTYLDVNHLWTLNLETGSVLENAVADAASFLYRSGGGAVTNVKAGAIFRGPGRIHFSGGTPLNAENGDWLIQGAPLELAGMVLNCPQTGSLKFQPNDTAPITWSAGTIHGNLDILQGVTIHVTGTGNYKDLAAAGLPGTLTNRGTIRWAGGSWQIRGYGGTGAATINNEATGVFDIAGDSAPLYHENATNLVFNNRGRIVKSAGTGGTYLDTNHLWTLNLETGSVLENAVADPASVLYRSGGGAVTNVKAGAIFRGPGRIHFGGGTPLNAENGTWHLQGAPLELAGMVLNCPQSGSLKFQPTDTAPITWSAGTIHGNLEILPGTTLHVTGAGAYKDLGAATLPATLTNRGTVRWTEGSWQIRGYGGTGAATINNETTGVFDIAGNGNPLYHINASNLVFNNRGRIVKSAGAGGTYLDTNHLWTLNLETGSVLENAVADPASVLYRSGGLAITNVKAGAIFRGPGRIHFAGGTPLNATETGAWNLTGGVPFELAGMTLNCPATGGLTLQATGGAAVSWTAGTITGILNISTGTAFTVTGLGAYKDLGAPGQPGILNNAGTLTWTNGWPIRGYGGTGAATLHNQAGGVLHLASSGNVFYHQTPTGNTLINSGAMHIGASPGVVDGTWSFTQNPTGILNIEVAGPAAAEYDRLAFGGTATLSGSVSVTKLNGYAPAEGTTFPFLTAGTVTGTFGIVTGGFSAEYTGTSATLRAVAAAQTFDQWAASKGLTGANALPAADPDKDGYSNFFEYVHNMSPTAASGPPDTTGTETIDNQQWLTLKYRRYDDREAAGVTYTPETGSSLGGWNPAGIIEEVDPAAPVVPGSTACRCRVLIVPSATKFLRVKAVKP